MKVYKFECENCGSKKYERVDEHTYKCLYCGCEEKILSDNETKPAENLPQEEPTIKDTEKEELNVKLSSSFWSSLKIFILCAIFGYLGVHKFMQKKYFVGIVYLCTCGLLGIGWIYDIIVCSLNLAREFFIIARERKNEE